MCLKIMTSIVRERDKLNSSWKDGKTPKSSCHELHGNGSMVTIQKLQCIVCIVSEVYVPNAKRYKVINSSSS